MSPQILEIETQKEGMIDITSRLNQVVASTQSGLLIVQNSHTSCGLTINEAFDPSAKEDMENFLRHLAPENLKFIKHTDEGPDDSPSHMKSLLVQPTLSIIIEDGKLMLGKWQGVYLCEFRRSPKLRRLFLKILKD
ncbi:MAG: hypothetical protein CME71_12485 [Halobacteriovorax sp.]|nr:hypothetical protein [Halobacteriovorax sp.]|tara:strand:- start:2367 stop:2774 length:408 start_codon:yes stop_codon:yes gene_type:complete